MRRAIIFSLCFATALTACTTETVMRPDVDVGTQTAALLPPPAPVSQVDDYGNTSLAAEEAYPMTPAPQNPVIQDQLVEEPIGRDAMIDEPVGRDTMVEGPVVEEPVRKNTIVASLSRAVNPFGLGADQDGNMPAEEASCRKQLRKLGVTYRDLPPINDGGSCRIEYPVQVTGLPGRATLKPAATLNCHMALAFSQWVKSELQPAARARYWSSVGTVTQASSYSCRNMIGTRGNKLSEHAKGNAIDISKIELKNGKDILVRKKGFFAFRERGLLNTVRADGCSYFSTVLGPGYNRAHADHFHFDIMDRKSGFRACK
ncbi:MAG: extensin family protein [Rhizobiaceae bacterium]